MKTVFFTDSELNRDNCLRPMIMLKQHLSEKGISVNTLDLWDREVSMDYYSFGMLENLGEMSANEKVTMKAFYVFEPALFMNRRDDCAERLFATCFEK